MRGAGRGPRREEEEEKPAPLAKTVQSRHRIAAPVVARARSADNKPVCSFSWSAGGYGRGSGGDGGRKSREGLDYSAVLVSLRGLRQVVGDMVSGGFLMLSQGKRAGLTSSGADGLDGVGEDEQRVAAETVVREEEEQGSRNSGSLKSTDHDDDGNPLSEGVGLSTQHQLSDETPDEFPCVTPGMVHALVADSRICPRVHAEDKREQIMRAWRSRETPPGDDYFVNLLSAHNPNDPYSVRRHSRSSADGGRRRSRGGSMDHDILKARGSFIKDRDKAWIYRAIRAIVALQCIRQEGFSKPVKPSILDEDEEFLEKRVKKREQSILRVFHQDSTDENTPPKVLNADFCEQIDGAERRMRMLMAVTKAQLDKQKRLNGEGRVLSEPSRLAHTIEMFVDRAAVNLNQPLPLASMSLAERPFVAHSLARDKALSSMSPRAAHYYAKAMEALPGNEALRKSFEKNVPAHVRQMQQMQQENRAVGKGRLRRRKK
eukprot:g2390.t1